MVNVVRLQVALLLLTACFPAAPQAPAAPSAKEASKAPAQGRQQSRDPSEALDKAARSLDVDTDSGVVTNQTITVAGQDFYHYFVAAWRDKSGSERYTLAIHERPSARWGSEVWIDFGQHHVFRTYLPPARAAIKPIGEEAAEIAFQAVMQADLQRQLVHDPDLGRDEF